MAETLNAWLKRSLACGRLRKRREIAEARNKLKTGQELSPYEFLLLNSYDDRDLEHTMKQYAEHVFTVRTTKKSSKSPSARKR